MSRFPSWVIGGVVVGAIGVGAVAVALRGGGEKTEYKSAAAERRDLQQTVSATGIVQPFTVVDIKSRAGGEILDLPVEVGDRVRKGTLIARVDPTDSKTAFEQAEADVSAAQARISQTEQTLALQRTTTETGIAEAEARLRAAAAQVRSAEAQVAAATVRLEQARQTATAQSPLTESAIRQAKASLAAAEKQLAQLTGTTDPQARQDARSTLATAKANLDNAQINLTRQKALLAKGFVSQSAVDAALAQRETAQAQFDAARTRAETVGSGQEAAIAAAESRVLEARETVRAAETNRVQIVLRQQDVRNAEASLAQARAALAASRESLSQARAQRDAARANRLQIGIRAADIAGARAQIARAQAAQRNTQIVLDQTTIRAPSDGVILQKYVEKGTIIASGSAFSAGTAGQSIVQIGDLTRMFVDAAVDETDIGQIRPGMKVSMSFDAFPDETFEGIVQRTEPRGVTDQNITTIKTRIELRKPDPRLRPGMNGECEFLVAEKKGVLVIPLRAVRTEQGRKFVQVLPADPAAKPVSREVQVGMQTSDSVEVLSGLKEGEKVVTATITPGPPKGGPGGAGGADAASLRGGGRR